jgi:EmrB/QacA subfamily drug resistance transporter
MSTRDVPVARAAKTPARSRRRWAALAAILLATFMDLMDNTIVTVSLPAIQHSLGSSDVALEWITSAYTLTFALGLITGGRLGDRYGRKTAFIAGVLAFTAFSALCGVSGDTGLLIVARILQGAAAAVMIPPVLTFIREDFTTSERGKAFALYGTVLALGGVSGPLLGGLLTNADLFGLGWRPIFLINVPIGLIAAAGTAVWARQSRDSHAPRLDLTGALIVTIAVLALLFPLIEGPRLHWPVWGFVAMAASVPILIFFAVVQARHAAAGKPVLMSMSLFRHRSVVGGLLAGLVFFCGMGVFFVFSLYLQNGLQYTALHTGLTFLPFAVGVMFGSGLSIGLLPKIGRYVPFIGSLVMALGEGMLAYSVHHFGLALTTWEIIPGVLVCGIGLASVSSTLVNIVLAKVPERDTGAVSGVINTALQIGGAAGIAISGTLLLSLVSAGRSFTSATTTTLAAEAAIFVAAAVATLVIPPGKVHVEQ